MANKSNCDRLAARFDTKAANGLVDVKFFVRNLDEASSEVVCSEVNAMYEAVDAGRSRKLVFNDSQRKSA